MRRNKPVKNLYDCEHENFTDQIALLTKGKKAFPDIPTFFGAFKTPIGIEVEVENVANANKQHIYWGEIEDGSLKDSGIEYVSKPIAGHNIDYALAELKTILAPFECKWSHRTSIHVHIYVGDISEKKLRVFTALYAVMENLFFSQVANIRQANPYCYPLCDIAPSAVTFGQERLKYCALNVGTGLRNYNTVEFRHMHGNDDWISVRRWIQLIVKLHKFVKVNRSDYVETLIMELNTTSAYMDLVKQVFGNSAIPFLNRSLKEDMEGNVLWAKLFLLGE